MPESKKARAVGFNHVALEVGEIEAALAFYARIFDFKLRSKSATAAFIYLIIRSWLKLFVSHAVMTDEG